MLNSQQIKNLKIQASEICEKTVELICSGGGGHIGGDLSEVDILTSLFKYMKHDPENPEWADRDYFILSKGHSAEAYYILLSEYGYLTEENLGNFGNFGALLGGHPSKKIPGVEANTGSLGHGLGLATGIALALKKNNKKNRVFVLTGDGELGEGSNWEALMSASKYKLDNLTWIVDRNFLQISGTTEEVMPLENLKNKAEAFGFKALDINGHDFDQIFTALDTRVENYPICIIANTIKGKGLACAENKAEWHHKTPTPEQLAELKKDMAAYREALV
ncbi:MAG: transketolase [Spirochaetales bacterium]|nr:transketolase [Spirochaetales bacterium]